MRTILKIELFNEYIYYDIMKIEISKYNLLSNSDEIVVVSKDLMNIIKIYLYLCFTFDFLFCIFVEIKKSRVALAGLHGVFILRTYKGVAFMATNISYFSVKSKYNQENLSVFAVCRAGKPLSYLLFTNSKRYEMKESTQQITSTNRGVRMYSLMIPIDLYDRIRNESHIRNLNKKQLIVKAVENYLETN